ncbi:unnamed protein product [Clonostachys solani]|uniref:Uncharacterized protein n=1 Tax=Clonostachys solani TaxID=160281 RepID=A0A9N9YZC9_9HYPO|nr:unnamed protein product [Clonostachys solani]
MVRFTEGIHITREEAMKKHQILTKIGDVKYRDEQTVLGIEIDSTSKEEMEVLSEDVENNSSMWAGFGANKEGDG